MTSSDKPDKLDCHTQVITPENIKFEYAVAGPFQRLPAYLLDIVIWNSTFLAVVFLASFLFGMLGLAGIDLSDIVQFLIWVLYFALSWFYGVFFEAYYNGKTPGKAILRLRTISTDGRPINAVQAGLRNILRVADLNFLLSLQLLSDQLPNYPFFPTMIVGLVAMLATGKLQRVGDLAAGTMVISENKKSTPWNLQPDDLRAFGLAELIPASFEPSNSLTQAVGMYMENRKKLHVSRREEIAARLAKPLIRKFGLLPNTGCDLLLCALYVRIYHSQAQQAHGLESMRQSVVPPKLSLQIPPVAQPSTPSSSVQLASSDPSVPVMVTAPIRPADAMVRQTESGSVVEASSSMVNADDKTLASSESRVDTNS